MEYFITVLGMVLIVEGLPYFTFPEKMKAVMEKIPLFPSRQLRVFGLTLVIIGLLIIYLTKHYFR